MGLPVEVNNLMLGSVNGYTVGRSLRFRSSASAYLNRTPASAGSQTTWTWSGWVKRGSLGGTIALCQAGSSTANETMIMLDSDSLRLYNDASSVTNMNLVSTAVFRDPSAWYHFLVVYNSTQATSTNRVSMYVNGVQITSFSTSTYPAQNQTTVWNSAVAHSIGERRPSGDLIFDGYLAEVNFIDGQALTPSSFGAYDTNGIWQPKKYSGTYGTNGFYLPFSNTTSTTTLVQDSSGNGNNWTPNNISLTAGTTYDSMIDSPTVSASSSNYCVLNYLKRTDPAVPAGTAELSSGNLNFISTSAGAEYVPGTIGVTSGKWYFEVTVAGNPSPGLQWVGINTSDYGSGAYIRAYRNDNGQYYNGTAWAAYGATYAAGDVIGVAFDLDGQTIEFFKNNVSQGQKTSIGVSGQTMFPAAVITQTSGAYYFNFGQRPFTYTPPTGFVALNTYNLPTPTIKNGALYNAATLYTGTGADATILNSASSGGNNPLGKTFYPDFTWIKSRSAATNNDLFNSVVGATKYLNSNNTNAEATNGVSLTSFNSNGFGLGSDSTPVGVNVNAATYVAWQWNAGSGSSSSNTNGSITSTVSVNATAGFSIVTYTGTGANATVGHGLGVAPSMIIAKSRSGVKSWPVYHISVGSSNAVYLDLNQATSASTNWNGSPTSSVFGIGTGGEANTSGATMVAYCFAPVSGYSAFGSFIGNGSADGPFVFLNFRPRFVLTKNINQAAEPWMLQDTSRSTYNLVDNYLRPNYANAETSGLGHASLDYLSNGFKVRNSGLTNNGSGNTIIYMAFAENPFSLSRAR